MSLFIQRAEGQSWRDAAIAQGRKARIERDVTETYDALVASGTPEDRAAWEACYEWDALDFRDDPE